MRIKKRVCVPKSIYNVEDYSMRILRHSFTCFYGILGEFEKKVHIYTITNLKGSFKPIFLKNTYTCSHISSANFNLRLANYFQPYSNIYKKKGNSAQSYGTLFSFT